MKKMDKKKIGSFFAAVILGASSIAGLPISAFAEEEIEIASETEEAAAALTDLSMDLGNETVAVANDAGPELNGAVLVLTEDEYASADETEAESESSDTGNAAVVELTETDGTVHSFEIEDTSVLLSLSELKLTEKIGFLFLSGIDSEGEERFYYEDADEITLTQPVTMYTVAMVNIREEGNGDSELLGTAERGSELEVLGGTPSWFLISQDEVTGYVAARYLTEDSSEAEAAVEQEANARAAAEAAAAAAAAQYSSGSSDGSTGTTGGGGAAAPAATDDACLTGGVLN